MDTVARLERLRNIPVLPKIILLVAVIIYLCRTGAAASPVYIGFDGEIGHVTSTSDDAVEMGIRIAMAEINAAGGVLNGRPLELLVKDHRSVPARGVANIKAFAEVPDLVAVVGGKFSSVMLEELPLIHEKKIILLDAWGAADGIIDNGYAPNYCFRLSLKDSWAITTMMDHLAAQGVKRVGVLLPITGWGRSNNMALEHYLSTHPELMVTERQWYNLGDSSLLDKYLKILKSKAKTLLLIANEPEGAILVKNIAGLPPAERLPITSHWGISGGAFTELTGAAISQVELAVVQTYSFYDNQRPEKLKQFYQTADKLFQVKGPDDIPSPVGTAHAYDLINILARAIDQAGSTERPRIRDALEQVTNYDGLIKFYPQPFTPTNHEALRPEDLFLGYFRRDGAILRLGR